MQADRQEDDLDLLRKSGDGDSAAFHRLVDKHSRRLYRIAYSLLGNASDAEDAVQETFAGAYRGIKRFEARSSVQTWLTRILVTQCARVRRDRKRRRSEPMDAGMPEPSIGSASSGIDNRIDLKAALQSLSFEHREVLTLREYEQLSYDEIAKVLEIPRGTVESRLFRARNELKLRLKSFLP